MKLSKILTRGRSGQGGRSVRALTLSLLVAVLATGLPVRPAAAEEPPPLPPPPGPWATATLLDVGPLDPPDLELLQRTDTTNVFRRPDGNGELFAYAGPVNWQAPDGRWVPLDATVISDGLGRFRNRSGPITASFAGVSGGGPLVQVGTDAWSVGFTLEGMLPSVAAATDRNTVRYPGLLGGADVEYTVGRDVVKEILSLPNAAAAGSGVFRFPLELSGVAAHQGADGSFGFYDAAGIRVASIPNQGAAWDSSGDPATGQQPRQAPVAVRLVDDGAGLVVEVEAPRSLLDDPATVWPVKIDPDVRFPKDWGDSWDSYVRSNQPTWTQQGTWAESLGGQYDPANGGFVTKAGYTGYPCCTVEYDSYFLYDLSAANNQNILTGQWVAYRYIQGQNPTSRYVLWPVADPYDPNTVTFNTRPNHFSSGLCDGNYSKCYGPGASGYVAHDIQPWVHNWTHYSQSGWNNRGIVVDSGGEPYSFFTFISDEDLLNLSYIRVVYNLPPTASALAPNGGYQTTTTPQLCATWTDPNLGNPGSADTGYVVFRVYNSGGTQVWSGNSATLGNNGRGCVTTGALGQGYHSWSAEADDFRQRSGPVWASFTVDTVKPGTPTLTSSSHGVESPPGAQWYSSRTVAAAISGPSGDTSGIAGYSASVDQSSSTLPGATVNSTGSYTNSTSITADGQWYVHARAKDNAGWWSDSARHYGIWVDSTPPTAPTITTSSHAKYLCTSIRTISMNWLAGADVTSGVLGYSWVFNNDQAAAPDNTVDTTGLSATYTVPVNADGTYWFHVATVDKAGNKNTTDQVYGPICIDSTADPVTLSPTLLPDMVAQSDQVGLEQFAPYKSFPLGSSGTGYVQLRSGNLTASFDDATIPNQGLNTVIRHVYNSQRQSSVLHDNGLSQGWSLSVSDLDAGLDGVEGALEDFDVAAPMTAASATVVDGAGTIAGYLLEFTDGDGTTHRFIRKGGIGSRWDSPPGVSLRVREVVSGGVVTAYELVRPDGVIYKAENLKVVKPALGLTTNTWRVTSIRDRRGDTLTFDYNLAAGQVRLSSISHNRNGVVASLTWDATTGRLSRITTLQGVTDVEPVSGATRSYERWVDFVYDANGRLWKVNENAQSGSDAARTTEFAYTSGQLTSVKDGRGNTTRFAYTGSGYSAQMTTLTDRRQSPQPTPKTWAFAYGTPDPTTGQQDTVVTSPAADQVTYRTSGRGAIQPTGADRRIAGGNIIAIIDAGFGAGAVTRQFSWEENRLYSKKDGLGNETKMKYNDLGLLVEITEPAPNDPGRNDLPTGAPKVAVTHKLAYRYDAAWRHPSGCTDPAPGNANVTEEGYCYMVADLLKATYASGDTAQRVVDFDPDAATGNLRSVIERYRSDGAAQAPSCSSSTGVCTGDRTTTFAYYTSGALKTVDGPRGETANDGLYPADDLTTYGDTADAANGAYDRTGAPTRITDAAAKTKTFQYSPYGPTVKETDRDNRITKWRYDDRDNLVEMVDPKGNRITSAFDANDNKTRDTTPRGQLTPSVADDFTTIWTYDNNDWQTQASWPGANPTDPRRVATVTYADDGAKTAETTPRSSSQINFAYTPNRTLKQIDAPGQTANSIDRAVTDYGYDTAGRVTQVDAPAGNTTNERARTTFTYTPSGAVAQQQVIANATQTQTTLYAYNAHGEPLQTKGPGKVGTFSHTTEQTYSPFAEVTRTRRYKTATTWVDAEVGYDQAGNQVRTAQPTGAGATLESLYRYDALGRLSAQTKDPENPSHTVAYSYDGEGRQTERLDKDGATNVRRVASVYNPDGTLQSEVAKNETAGTTLATCNYADGAGDLTSGYDADGNPLVTRTVSGTTGCTAGGTTLKTQTFAYAAANNWMTSSTQTLRSPDNGTSYSRTQSFAYEADGALDSATWDGRLTSYDHSPAGWLTSMTDWRSRASTNAYFPSGALKTAQRNNNALTGTWDYQRNGAPTSLTWNAGANVLRSHTGVLYDDGGQRTQEAVALRQPGASSTTSGTAKFAYDALNRLTSWVAPFAETSDSSQNTVYTLDDGGNITQEIARTGATAGSGSTRTTATSTFTDGRLTSRVTVYSSLIYEADCEKFWYDALGEETSRYFGYTSVFSCPSNPSATRSTSYDPAGHAAGHDDKTLNQYDINYVYDADGGLIARTDPFESGSAKTTLYFYWGSGDTLAEETDGTGQTMVRYLTDDTGQAVAQESHRTSTGDRNATATWNWLLGDLAGNVGTVCDDTGVVLEQAAFDPYGQPKTGGAGKTTSSSYGRSSLGYQHALTDRTPGSAGTTRALILKDRQYDPSIRRFTTEDSFVAGGLDLALGVDALTGNRYLYAAANPVGYYDDGHAPKGKGKNGCGPGYRKVRGPFGIWEACKPVNSKGPNITDNLARNRLVANSGGVVTECARSKSGQPVFCVQNVKRLPSADPGAGAVTYGHFIFCGGSCDSLLAHELVHVGQWEKYGDKFGIKYLIEAAKRGTGCRNKYEREAYTARGGGGCPEVRGETTEPNYSVNRRYGTSSA